MTRWFALLTCLIVGCAEVDMATAESYTVAGLWRSSNPATEMPPGALNEAKNIVIRKPGIAELRQRFLRTPLASLPGGYNVVRIATYEDGLLLFARNSSGNYHLAWDSAAGPVMAGASALQPHHGYWATAEARKNLYIGSTAGVRKSTAAGSSTTRAAGLLRPPAPVVVSTNDSNSAIQGNHRVAYRVTRETKDANSLTVVSAPSSRMTYDNNSANSRSLTLRIYLDDSMEAGESLKIYRSFNTASTPSDEMFLVNDHEITPTNVLVGYHELVDNVADASLGEALYTSPSRQGILLGNERPPIAKALEVFRGSMFYGNTAGPHRIQLSFTESGNVSEEATGIGTRALSVTHTNGSNQLTSASNTTGLKVGMLLLNPGTDWTGTSVVRITAISGTTLTMSETYTGGNVSTSRTFADSVRIESIFGSEYFPASYVRILLSSITSGVSSDNFFASYRVDAPSDIAYAYGVGDSVNTRQSSGIVTGMNRAIVIEERGLGSAGFSVWATHGDEYFPPLPEPTEATGRESVSEVKPNGLAWSKQDQPEHVPLTYSTTVGDERHPILQMLAARDVLYIFKTDGVFRLSGFGPQSGWRIDPVDPSLRLIAPGTAVYHDGNVWCWTNRGIGILSEMGFQTVSQGPLGAIMDPIEATYLPGQYTPTIGAWVVSSQRNNELIWGVANMAGTITGPIFVFNTHTKTWVEWELEAPPYHMAEWPATNQLVGFDQGSVFAESPEGDDVEWLIEWHPHQSGPAHVEKMWQEAIFSFEATTGLVDTSFRFTSSGTPGTPFVLSVPNSTFPSQHRVWVPADHARHPRIRTAIGGEAAAAVVMQLSGMVLTYEPYSTRVRPL